MATSIEEIREILAEMGRSAAESDKAWRESRAETERVLAENRAETERVLTERRAEWERELAESRAERERAMQEMAEARKDTDRSIKSLSSKFGGLHNSVGQLVQIVVLPGIKDKINTLGHSFTMASVEKEYFKENGKSLTEVDLLLENCQDVMVVEVKTTLTLNDIEHHLERLRLLRKNEAITGMTGKTMYAAIACIRFKTGARELAVENGMYVIEIEEDEERIKIVPPETVGRW
jgi:DNA-binding transcriptional MerR regulator